jgi:nucleotide-binding universal stress UspA family protein
MLRRILVATDGSERAQRAEACAGELAPSEIELLYVYPRLLPDRTRPDPHLPWHLKPGQLAPAIREQATRLLADAEARVRRAAGAADVRIWSRFVASPDVAGVIVHEGERAGADLIVMGGRAHRGLLPRGGAGICTVVLERSRRRVLLVG